MGRARPSTGKVTCTRSGLTLLLLPPSTPGVVRLAGVDEMLNILVMSDAEAYLAQPCCGELGDL